MRDLEVNTSGVFNFKQFTVVQRESTMKVNTDAVLLGAWAPRVFGSGRILDIGTGTGVIALMLAQQNPEASVIGVEIDEKSGNEAKYNAKSSVFSDRVRIVIDSIQHYVTVSEEQFDLIVTNPPFFSGGTHSTNENKLHVRHSVKLPHNDLIRAVNHLLKKDGVFSLILPYIEGLRFVELAAIAGLNLIKRTEVYSKEGKSPERLLMSFSRLYGQLEVDSLSIRDRNNVYTREYKQLTQDFYLNF